MSLVIISTHPIQYHAPVYRLLQQRFGIEIKVIYGSDQGVTRYLDKEFNTTFAWDTDLISGYQSFFLNRSNSKANLDSSKIASFIGVEAAIDACKPKAVLILGYAVLLYQKAWFHAVRKKYPVMFRMEAHDEFRGQFFAKRVARNYILKVLYKRTNAFLYIGKACRDHYQRLDVPEHKLFFSPYSVDTAPFAVTEEARNVLRCAKRRELGIGPDDIALLFSGKIIKKKNPAIILDALRLLPEDVQKKIVVLYLGDGPLKHFIQIKSKDNLSRTIFCGFKNQTELSPFYHAADALILPSLFQETWGLVVNEALAHGLCCVVSNHVGCHQDLIQPGLNGEVFKGMDTVSLANSILAVISRQADLSAREYCRKSIAPFNIFETARSIAEAYGAISNQGYDASNAKETKRVS